MDGMEVVIVLVIGEAEEHLVQQKCG